MQALPPWTLPGSRPGEKNGPAGLSVQKGARRLPPRTGEKPGRTHDPGGGGRKSLQDMPRMATGSPCAGPSPLHTQVGSRPGEKTALRASQGKMGERPLDRRRPPFPIQDAPPEGDWTSEGILRSSKGRGAGGKPPKTWPHWRSEARGAVFRAGRLFLSPPRAAASPKGLKKAREGPERRPGPAHPPITGWDGPGGKNRDMPGPSGRRPSPDSSHHAAQARRAARADPGLRPV